MPQNGLTDEELKNLDPKKAKRVIANRLVRDVQCLSAPFSQPRTAAHKHTLSFPLHHQPDGHASMSSAVHLKQTLGFRSTCMHACFCPRPA